MALALSLLAPLCAAQAPAATPLKMIGGEASRTIALQPCRVASHSILNNTQAIESGNCRSEQVGGGRWEPRFAVVPSLTGSLPLALSNTSHKLERVQNLYVRNDGATTRLPGASSFVSLHGERSPHSPHASVTVPARAIRVLRLRFMLPPDRPPTALDGTLSVYVLGASTQLVSIPVVTADPAPAGLRLEPSELTLSTCSWWDGASTTVTLVGPGAGAYAAASDARPHTFVLRNDSDHEVKLKLGEFQVERSDPGRVSAKLSLAGDPPHPGGYHGDVTLFSLSPEAPRLKLTVNSHLPFWFVIIVVFIGALIGGLASFVYALSSRRNALFKALEEARTQLNAHEVDNAKEAMWNLDDLAKRGSVTANSGSPDSHEGDPPGVYDLHNRIETARNDRDLDEDTSAILDVVARIQRWLRLAPAAWRLRIVAEGPPEGSDDWRRTRTWHDTRLLQERLRREPKGVAEVDDLAARVQWQILWHHKVANLFKWANRRNKKRLLRLDRRLGHKDVYERTPAERDELGFALERLHEQLKAPKPGDPPDLPMPYDNTVNWQASPNLFTGWATVDGTSWTRVRTRAVRGMGMREPHFAWRPPNRWDLLWLVVPVVGASTVYALTIYNEAWGSLIDVLTALTAGFVGKLAIDWATLPIFQSRRLRALVQSSAKTPAPAPSSPAPSSPTAPTAST